MKRKIIFWFSLVFVLTFFTVVNWIIHSHDRWWFNTLDHSVGFEEDSITVGLDYYADDYHGIGEIWISSIEIDGAPVEFEETRNRQSTFHLGDRYKLDAFYVRVSIDYDESYLNQPMRIRGGIRYTHRLTNNTYRQDIDIESIVSERDNRLVFDRKKLPIR